MQAVMNIMVNVQGARAAQRQLAAVNTATRGTAAATTAATTMGSRFHRNLGAMTKGMERYGKNMQWVGRQIEYNFTLPIALASGLSLKFAMDNERAMVRLKKVYGDNSMPTKQFTEETEALGRAFRFLSDQFGAAQNEVIDAGATFAQAGAGNVAVARGVHAALELQILGEMELVEATEALIAVQAQYNVSSRELTQIIADMNAVENTTTVTLEDQISAMQRSAGVAREAGVNHRELSGMIASMVPAAGNAQQAGNSLKTTLTRIMAPTRQARDAMEGLGIETEGLAWRNATATERLMELSEALQGVGAEQRTVALTHIAGRRQVARLAVLLRDMANEQGRYATALEVTQDPAESMLRKQREIDTYLRSGPQGFTILVNQLRNYAAEIGAQLMPTLLAVMVKVRDLARAFAELDPDLRKSILSFILIVAVVGPFVRIMGSSVLLVTQFIKLMGFLGKGLWIAAKGFGVLLKAMGGVTWLFTELPVLIKNFFIWIPIYVKQYLIVPLGKALTWLTATFWPALKAIMVKVGAAIAGLMGPVGWIAAAVIALGVLAWVFRDEIGEAFTAAGRWIADVWNRVFEGVRNVLKGIVDTTRNAVRAVVDLFSQMLNPFGQRRARPQPPTVAPIEGRASGGDVRKGQLYLVGEDGPELFSAGSNGSIIPSGAMQSGRSTLSRFQSRVQPARDAMRQEELAGMRSDVTGWVPEAGPEFDEMVRQIQRLESELGRVEVRYERQEQVVATWEDRLDMANRVVERHEDKLRDLRDAASAVGDELRTAQAQLDEYANMPIEGMREMEDALWANEQAQKELRLQLLDIEDAEGPIDGVRTKLAELQGDIEMLSGKREDLRLAGAGSDVLGAYDTQIDSMRDAQKALMGGGGESGSVGEAEKLRNELEELQREAERMQLERDLEFDPLTRELQRMADGYKEMPFADIAAAIRDQQGEVARLTSEYDKANAAVEKQEAVLARATQQRDGIQRTYDQEQRSLEILKEAYTDLQGLIRDMNSELEGFARDAAAAAQAAADAAEAAAGGSGLDEMLPDDWGDYEIPGGDAGLKWEEGSIDDLISEWEEGFGDLFGDFDLFAPIREMWQDFNDWLFSKWHPAWEWVKETWNSIWTWIKEAPGNAWEWIKTTASDTWESVTGGVSSAWESITGFFSDGWTSVKEQVSGGWDAVKGFFSESWQTIKDGVSEAWETIKGYFSGPMEWLKERWYAFWNTEIGYELMLTLLQWREWILSGWNWITGFLTATWETIKAKASEVWNSIRTFFSELWASITEAISTAWNGVKLYFAMLWLSIKNRITEVWNSISGWFSDKWEAIKKRLQEVWNSIKEYFLTFWEPVETRVKSVWNRISGWFSVKWAAIKGIGVRIWESFREYLSGLWGRITGIFTNAWAYLRDLAGAAWELIKGAIVAVLRVLRGDIDGAVARVREAVVKAWSRIRERTAEIWGNVRQAIIDKINSIKGVVRRGRDSIGRLWDNIKNKIRAPIAAAVDVAINPIIRGINKVSSKVGLGSIPTITVPQFHKGGVVGQGGEPRNLGRRPLVSDEQLAVVRRGERVLTEEERKLLEGDPAYAQPEVGGPLSWARDVASSVAREVRGVIADTARPAVNAALRAVERIPGADTYIGEMVIGLGRRLGDGVLDWLEGADDQMPKAKNLSKGGGYKAMWQAVSEQFPWARLTSGFRPGAITATGNPSYHAQGRAVDLAGRGFMDKAGMAKINHWIYENYKDATKELIYSGMGAKQVHNGSDHWYSGITRSMHYDHVHWAMDKGGFLNQGWNQPIFNGTGRPEIVSPERLMRRIVREEVQAHGSGGDSTININGDLVLPNIKDGDDAEDFIRNIESLAGR